MGINELSTNQLIELAITIESLNDEQRMQISRYLDSLEDEESRSRMRTCEIIPA